MRRCATRFGLLALLLAILAAGAGAPARAASDDRSDDGDDVEVDVEAAGREMSTFDAVVLGVVEGVTEFLPISSTGHLIVTQRLLDVGQDERTEEAMDAYTVIIQVGAILAVLLLYRHRVRDMVLGLVGRSETGLRLVLAVVVAFVPAVVVALALEGPIKDHLLEVGPVVAAWAVGGLVIFAFVHRFRDGARGRPLEALTLRQAFLIGVAQTLALWPGTSRSLVTLLAGLLLGLRLAAAVEFAFLLGLVTLSAATVYELATAGSTVADAYGVAVPLLGVVAAFVSAAAAVRWMVGYLNRHDLAIFGWYRLAAAAVTVVLLAAGAL